MRRLRGFHFLDGRNAVTLTVDVDDLDELDDLMDVLSTYFPGDPRLSEHATRKTAAGRKSAVVAKAKQLGLTDEELAEMGVADD